VEDALLGGAVEETNVDHLATICQSGRGYKQVAAIKVSLVNADTVVAIEEMGNIEKVVGANDGYIQGAGAVLMWRLSPNKHCRAASTPLTYK
jgi:hypothetical protein